MYTVCLQYLSHWELQSHYHPHYRSIPQNQVGVNVSEQASLFSSLDLYTLFGWTQVICIIGQKLNKLKTL